MPELGSGISHLQHERRDTTQKQEEGQVSPSVLLWPVQVFADAGFSILAETETCVALQNVFGSEI